MIRKSGLKISTWIGVLDGCCEGGNPLCVHEMPFFGKVLDLIPDKGCMNIITDHSPYLFNEDGWGKPRSENRFIFGDSLYETALIKERIPGFRKRACEFVIRKKCQVNDDGEPRSSANTIISNKISII